MFMSLCRTASAALWATEQLHFFKAFSVTCCRSVLRGLCTDKQPPAVEIPRTYKKMRGTGDKGTSGLFTNERRWKDDAVFEALGTTDELNSSVGKLRHLFMKEGLFDLCEKAKEIQCCLQDVASNVATPHSSAKKAHLAITHFDHGFIDLLDYWIDLYANRIPPLTKFILPGGNLLSSCLHQARCICRRAERTFTPLIRAEEVDPVVLQYVNRLSDFLFVLSRYVCFLNHEEELSYEKPKPRRSKKPAETTSGERWETQKF